MKWSLVLYVVLGTLGLAAVVLVPFSIHRSGTQAFPMWGAAASPGPLSSGHAFLGAQCESCHTPGQGINAVSCITCHSPAAAVLAKQSSTFHANVGECRGCHIEHQGLDVRPIRMEHSVLTEVSLRDAHAGKVLGQPATAEAGAIRRFLASTGSGPSSDSGPATDAVVLDCATCHSFQDRHQGLFGEQCADCHAVETWKIAGYLHPSGKSQDCNQCHQAPPSHYMMHFSMMDQGITGQRNARVEQCYACHLTNSFNEIKGIGWVKMH